MNADRETIRALQDALQHTPDNIPLLRHLADLSIQVEDYELAEQTCRQALALQPDNEDLKSRLAEAFFHQGKYSAALVILEALADASQPSAQTLLWLARVKLANNEIQTATKCYQRAKELDPGIYEETLENDTIDDLKVDEKNETNRTRDSAPGSEKEEQIANADLDSPGVSFRDVGGMEDLKEEIRMKIIHPLQHPDLYQTYGKQIGGGILLYGPPGCGKTYMARATAGEVNAVFITIGIHDILDLYLGESEKKLHNLFETARLNTPCVLFFDEVDALGAKRADMRLSGGRSLINQFLAELDGIGNDNEGILIMGATNAPWHLDPAFRRPGRFDRTIFVPPPDREAREEILRLFLETRPTEDIRYRELSKTTERFSGADLKAVVDLAVENRLRDAIRQGKPGNVTTDDLQQAASKLKPTTLEWLATARNYCVFSNEGGQYDDLKAYLKL